MGIFSSGCIISGAAKVPERKKCDYKSKIFDEYCIIAKCPHVKTHENRVFQLNGKNISGYFSRSDCSQTGDIFMVYVIPQDISLDSENL